MCFSFIVFFIVVKHYIVSYREFLELINMTGFGKKREIAVYQARMLWKNYFFLLELENLV
ncbi:hypothetical protein CEE45_03795 [Candidatus Heimdallarchaeota archaeon B3_Heim]|nr:MAG: hypothetical protein CEE45_03795 [Candidatus Heimdallarchaeota archaeon B3_Heim]